MVVGITILTMNSRVEEHSEHTTLKRRSLDVVLTVCDDWKA